MKHAFLLFTLISVTCFAQKPCEKDSVYNQFDFWVGEWNVYAKNGGTKLEWADELVKVNTID